MTVRSPMPAEGGASHRAAVPAEDEPAPGPSPGLSPQEQVRRQIDAEEARERRGEPAPSAEWRGSLEFLAEDARRARLGRVLERFDREMRQLQRRFADDGIPPAEYESEWKVLTLRREQAMLSELTPEEQGAWHGTVSPEAEALRELPTGFDEATLARVAAVEHEYAAALADGSSGEEGRLAARESRERRLAECLKPEEIDRLRRVSDPRYATFTQLAADLQLPGDWADYLFQHERWFAAAERSESGADRAGEVAEPERQAFASLVVDDIRARLSPAQFDRLMAQPQVWFLSVPGPGAER